MAADKLLETRRIFSPDVFEPLVLKTDVFTQAAALLRYPFSVLPDKLSEETAAAWLSRKRWWQFPILNCEPRLAVIAAVVKSWQGFLRRMRPTDVGPSRYRYLVTSRSISRQTMSQMTAAIYEQRDMTHHDVSKLCRQSAAWIDEDLAKTVFLSYCDFLIHDAPRLAEKPK